MSLILSGTNGLSDVDGTAATPAIRGTDANTGMFFPAADTIAFAEGGVEAMRLDSVGNVGIGTSSPTNYANYKSIAVGGVAGGAIDFIASNIGVGANRAAQIFSVSGGLGFATGASNNINEAARIDSSGNLLVGVTSGGSHRLYKTNNTGEALQIQNNSTTSGSRCLELTLLTNGDAAGTFIRCGDSGAFRFYVLGNGNALNSNGSYGTISDAKLKENVTEATPKLEKLNQVRVVNYNLIGEEQKQIGVIAQELEQIFPGMVDEIIDRDKDGNDLGTTTKSVKMSVFVPMLIKAIQEQQIMIEQLKADVAALKGTV